MEKLIELERGAREPEEVEELNIDNCKSSQISGLTDKYVNLQTLSMANCELTSLKGFPSLPNLRKLDLSDNRISEGLDILTGCPNLEYIGLSGNPIKTVSCLEPLKKLKKLLNLELFNCEVAADVENYREQIYDMLDNVLYIDGMDRNGQTAPDEFDGDDDDDEGASEEEEEEDSEEDRVAGEDDASEDDEGSEDEDDEARGTKRKHEDEENADDA